MEHWFTLFEWRSGSWITEIDYRYAPRNVRTVSKRTVLRKGNIEVILTSTEISQLKCMEWLIQFMSTLKAQ
jgi:hypothetical protein